MQMRAGSDWLRYSRCRVRIDQSQVGGAVAPSDSLGRRVPRLSSVGAGERDESEHCAVCGRFWATGFSACHPGAPKSWLPILAAQGVDALRAQWAQSAQRLLHVEQTSSGACGGPRDPHSAAR